MISDCTFKVQDDQLIMNLKEIHSRGSWSHLNYRPGICLQGLKKIT